MGTGTKWEVGYLKVKTTTDKETSDILYANGRMQVPVRVYIKAIKKGMTERFYLTQSELDTIKLVDYDDTANILSGGWTYSDEANDFNITLSLATSTASVALYTRASLEGGEVKAEVKQDDDNAQFKEYWVSTTKVENKKIAASIKQSDGKTITSHSTTFDSCVTLTGKQPITYTTDNITVTREDTADGDYQFEWQSAGNGNWYDSRKHWDQDNYYISTNAYTLKKADIHTYDHTGSQNGNQSDTGLAHCYGYKAADDKNLKLSFIWDFGKETTKAAGLYREATITDWFTSCGRKAHAKIDIKVNQKKNALCLTRLAIDCPDTIWGTQWSYYGCWFQLYDIYGNIGTFSASFSKDHNLIEIKNTNN
ncbi:hypothetical protein L873DRAFT_1830615 [Choiromyces venosus 120613-1]|uniref:Uncharacterized protein n=1 Tax=Choiromyces venosus 120613-1 TaxID=1336337 RepID=A0A3N4JIL3_9PEZI|nr:hypothetical protein L873DRAFT_1830615 [Choiromyces venosus 120613-1]